LYSEPGGFVQIFFQFARDAFAGWIRHLVVLCQISQKTSGADINAIAEIGIKYVLFDGICRLVRAEDKRQGRAAVRSAFDGIKDKIDAGALACCGYSCIEGRACIAEFVLNIGVSVHAFGRHAGIEQKGAPVDFQRDTAMQGDRGFETLFPNHAPRADHIGKNINAYGCFYVHRPYPHGTNNILPNIFADHGGKVFMSSAILLRG